ncbi:hypothetical protein [Paraburkholderia humisilvae]
MQSFSDPLSSSLNTTTTAPGSNYTTGGGDGIGSANINPSVSDPLSFFLNGTTTPAPGSNYATGGGGGIGSANINSSLSGKGQQLHPVKLAMFGNVSMGGNQFKLQNPGLQLQADGQGTLYDEDGKSVGRLNADGSALFIIDQPGGKSKTMYVPAGQLDVLPGDQNDPVYSTTADLAKITANS